MRGRRVGRGERGATMTEYALIVTLVVVAGIGSIQFLERTASRENGNLATCNETRPPPPECQIRAIAATTTTVPTGPTTTSSSTTTTIPPSDISTWDASAENSGITGPIWWAEVAIDVVNQGGDPVGGVTVRLEWTFNPDGPTFFEFCTTDADGHCAFHIDVNDPSAESVKASVGEITGENPVDPPTDDVTVDRP